MESAKTFSIDRICHIFGVTNVVDAVINSWYGKCVSFCDRIYFSVVCAHSKCPISFWHKYTRRTPFTLTMFYKVIGQQVLNFFPEILLSFRMKSKWKKVKVGKDREKAQSEKDSHSKNQGGKKPN